VVVAPGFRQLFDEVLTPIELLPVRVEVEADIDEAKSDTRTIHG
jgi:hypothetical protein